MTLIYRIAGQDVQDTAMAALASLGVHLKLHLVDKLYAVSSDRL
jgi:hypothetical protein